MAQLSFVRRAWRVVWRGGVVVTVLVFLVAAASTSGFATLGASETGARLERVHASVHFRDGTFHNTHATSMMVDGHAGSALHAWVFGQEQRSPPSPLPLWPHPERTLAQPPASGLRITWLGHSTTLLEIDGLRVLTDPQWSERASPSAWIGPKRFHPPPLALDDVGNIDVVIVSHDHYDHCDMRTLQLLAPHVQRFIVPLGIGAHLESWGIDPAHITELEWWEEVTVKGVRVVSTPAQHFSGRGAFNRDSTL
jgi:hypothetical protein